MKRWALALILPLLPLMAKADEGMWLPQLLKTLNEADMQARGMKMSADDIYSVNHSSLKDAVVSFGGFCTGELISPEGLILTNHHCGYGQIQSHSSVENDLLTNGFWAMSKEEELPNPGLFVTFIVRIEDVTKEVLKGATPEMTEDERQELVAENSDAIIQKTTAGTHYGAKIKSMFYGNEYYMFVTETYDDVRLVGAPPSAIGKFGGDTDNWMWPRHTGDFSMFRVYSAPDGSPAAYAKENVPLKPKHFLPINLTGVEDGDFTMVFGFPGRTQEYLTTYSIKPLVETTNPNRIKIRETKLNILKSDMNKDDKVRIQYSAKYARVANYYKKWIGENRGLKVTNAIAEKEALETKFQQWADANPARKAHYGTLLSKFEQTHKEEQDVILPYNYIREAAYGTEILSLAARFRGLIDAPASEREKRVDALKAYAKKYFKDYNAPTDEKVFAALMRLYAEDISANYQPEILQAMNKKYKANFENYAAHFFGKSILDDQQKVEALLNDFNEKSMKTLLKDPAIKLEREFRDIYIGKVGDVMRNTQNALERLNRSYTAGLREMLPNKTFYPDANSTMRVSYGVVDGSTPYDGMRYTSHTYLDGVFQKEMAGADDYVITDRMRELYADKNYGRYAENGKLPVCFTASNHTTGGNSGSPVIDGEGRLIGLNFDRSWESTMSDIKYDKDICRNIAVDIRYVLWVVDVYAGASHLVDEMTLVETKTPAAEEATAE
ncbi:S46 family peptidase [Persicobacter psychrovividus]|uniref:Dipeptidyl-peptidase n=1 Tax=Persicobacter psychrovividus TaxID=387638 RepID=A0ABM7VB19_9BACT|nr:Asp/Glu-specific dipeptidyl-peptidase [Persicobacter psychrovividus]